MPTSDRPYDLDADLWDIDESNTYDRVTADLARRSNRPWAEALAYDVWVDDDGSIIAITSDGWMRGWRSKIADDAGVWPCV